MEECLRKGKLTAVFNSSPVEFRADSVTLDVNGSLQEILNDYVWVFAGGEPPTAFLKKIGVALGVRDLTAEGSLEAKQASLSNRALAASPVEMSQQL
jgi:thioredoxin reductase